MNFTLKNILFVAAFVFCALFNQKAISQVLINEICSSNISTLQNANGKYDDWIELYNSGPSDVDLMDYSLTNNISDRSDFTFPSYILHPGNTILVFASDSSTEKVNHYEMAVNANSIWKYTSGNPSLDTNWRNPGFNDDQWTSGNGGFGFSDNDDGTTIPVSVSVMMRRTFNVSNISQIVDAIFMMDYDDGFVAYINGVEIARGNFDTHIIRPSWDDLADTAHEAQMYQGLKPDSFLISSSFLKTILKPGENILAVETHDFINSPTDMSSNPFLFFGIKSSDVFFQTPPSWFNPPAFTFFNADFKLSRAGETVYLINSRGNVIDQKSYPVLTANHSYGRIPDGAADWCYINTPTPLSSNNSSVCFSGYADSVMFSFDGGYYSSSQTISLSSSSPGSEIRYSINGDIPDTTDYAYALPLILDSTTVLRARLFTPGMLPGPVITNTYLINENIHLPVFSITTDSLNLWDYNTGIYVAGPNADTIAPFFGANFWEDWDKPASLEYFDKSHNLQLDFDADIEIYGNYSRQKPQKSFEIKLSDKNIQDEVEYPLISEKPFIDEYDNIILRNAGTDWNVVHFRDVLMQRIMKNTHSDYVAAEPTAVFLNGEFWGVYHLSEKHNVNWVTANYGYKKDEVNFLEEGRSVKVDEGSDASFFELYHYATTESPGTQNYYDEVNSKLDLKNFADYFIAETYYNNGDWIGEWTNNIKLWKPKKDSSKWKYIPIDFDYGLGLKGHVTDDRLAMARNPQVFSYTSGLFTSILENPTFKTYFINRYADLINTIYSPSNIESVMNQLKDSIAFDMIRHFEKWGRDTAAWNSKITDMMNFVNQRPAIMRDFIKTDFNLAGQVTLVINVDPPGAGRIELSTITPLTYPWAGVYFNGNPVTITAIPNPGFTFDYWSSNIITPNDYNQSTTYNFTSDDEIVAHFNGSSAPAQLTISEINYKSSHEFDVKDWIELHNYSSATLDISGWKISDEADHHKSVFPTGTVIPSNGYIVIPEDSQDFKKLFPDVSATTGELNFGLSNDGQIRIFDYRDSIYLSVTYDDHFPWPAKAKGQGYTCELLDPSGDLNNGNNWFAGCFGGSPGKAYSNILSTPISICGEDFFCSGNNVELKTLAVSEFNYQWILNDINIPGANSDTFPAMQTGIYSVFIEGNGCSTTSDAVTVSEVPVATDPAVTGGISCGSGMITLYASSADSIYWYDQSSGNLIGKGDSIVTPLLNQSSTYYAQAMGICPSNKVEVIAKINTSSCEELISIYPNPSDGNNITIESGELESGIVALIITDMHGVTVRNNSLNVLTSGRSEELNLEDLNTGVYIITVYQGDKVYKGKYLQL